MNHASDLILIGSTLLLALAAHAVGQKVHVPRVTLLLLLGALAGPDLLDLLPDNADQSFSLITQLTLAMVGFLLGERMSARDLRQGKEALIVSLAVTLLTAMAVILAVWAVTGNLPAALLLGGIATATAPAATLDVLREAGANGPLTRLVFQVVAIDDAWGAILFSVLLVAAGLLLGNGDLRGDHHFRAPRRQQQCFQSTSSRVRFSSTHPPSCPFRKPEGMIAVSSMPNRRPDCVFLFPCRWWLVRRKRNTFL